MNASKYLISTAAAVAVVGAIGVAYAQSTPPMSTDSTTTTPSIDRTNPNSGTSTSQGTQSPSTSSTANSGTMNTPSSSTPIAEPEVRADRN